MPFLVIRDQPPVSTLLIREPLPNHTSSQAPGAYIRACPRPSRTVRTCVQRCAGAPRQGMGGQGSTAPRRDPLQPPSVGQSRVPCRPCCQQLLGQNLRYWKCESWLRLQPFGAVPSSLALAPLQPHTFSLTPAGLSLQIRQRRIRWVQQQEEGRQEELALGGYGSGLRPERQRGSPDV